MDGFEVLLAAAGRNGAGLEQYPTSDELAKIRTEFVHIAGLSAGDKLRWKSDQYKDKRVNGDNGVFEVFRVLPNYLPGGECGTNHHADENDFTVIVYENGDSKKITEYSFDSRRFERVE